MGAARCSTPRETNTPSSGREDGIYTVIDMGVVEIGPEWLGIGLHSPLPTRGEPVWENV